MSGFGGTVSRDLPKLQGEGLRVQGAAVTGSPIPDVQAPQTLIPNPKRLPTFWQPARSAGITSPLPRISEFPPP